VGQRTDPFSVGQFNNVGQFKNWLRTKKRRQAPGFIQKPLPAAVFTIKVADGADLEC
jgi:hypothetical protein